MLCCRTGGPGTIQDIQGGRIRQRGAWGALDEKYLKTNTNLDFFEAMGVAAKNVRHGKTQRNKYLTDSTMQNDIISYIS